MEIGSPLANDLKKRSDSPVDTLEEDLRKKVLEYLFPLCQLFLLILNFYYYWTLAMLACPPQRFLCGAGLYPLPTCNSASNPRYLKRTRTSVVLLCLCREPHLAQQ